MTHAEYYEVLKAACDGKHITMENRLNDLLVASEHGPVQGKNRDEISRLVSSLTEMMNNDQEIKRFGRDPMETVPKQTPEALQKIFTPNNPRKQSLVSTGPRSCDRCDDRVGNALVHEEYLADDPEEAGGALCARCASDDDPLHFKNSWLLSW